MAFVALRVEQGRRLVLSDGGGCWRVRTVPSLPGCCHPWIYLNPLLAQSSAQGVRSGAEFQQRGQKSSADSFQMFPPGLREAARCCPGSKQASSLQTRQNYEQGKKPSSDPLQLALSVQASNENNGGKAGVWLVTLQGGATPQHTLSLF